MAKKKEVGKFVGTAVVDFTIGTNKPVKYSKGDTFSTDNEKAFNSLINFKKIKK